MSILFSIVTVSVYIPETVHEGSLFSTLSPAFFIFRFLNGGHSDLYEMVPNSSFDLCF